MARGPFPASASVVTPSDGSPTRPSWWEGPCGYVGPTRGSRHCLPPPSPTASILCPLGLRGRLFPGSGGWGACVSETPARALAPKDSRLSHVLVGLQNLSPGAAAQRLEVLLWSPARGLARAQGGRLPAPVLCVVTAGGPGAPWVLCVGDVRSSLHLVLKPPCFVLPVLCSGSEPGWAFLWSPDRPLPFHSRSRPGPRSRRPQPPRLLSRLRRGRPQAPSTRLVFSASAQMGLTSQRRPSQVDLTAWGGLPYPTLLDAPAEGLAPVSAGGPLLARPAPPHVCGHPRWPSWPSLLPPGRLS